MAAPPTEAVAPGPSAPHPGVILRTEFMVPLGLGVTKLAADLQVNELRLNQLVHSHGRVTMEIAFRLARYFGNTPHFWLNLQLLHDISEAKHKLKPKIDMAVQPRAD